MNNHSSKSRVLNDLGLDSSKENLAYEFWSNKFLGVLKNQIHPEDLAPYGIQSFAIHEKKQSSTIGLY